MGIEVFPDVEEYMLSNFDPEGPTLSEKFGLYNLNLASYEDEEEFIPGDPITIEFFLDTERVNHFLNMKITKFEMIDRMYEAEMENYWESIEDATHAHWDAMS